MFFRLTLLFLLSLNLCHPLLIMYFSLSVSISCYLSIFLYSSFGLSFSIFRLSFSPVFFCPARVHPATYFCWHLLSLSNHLNRPKFEIWLFEEFLSLKVENTFACIRHGMSFVTRLNCEALLFLPRDPMNKLKFQYYNQRITSILCVTALH